MKNSKDVVLLPIKSIHILNPRQRDKAKFQELVENVRLVGLKKPITVTIRKSTTKSGKEYNLVCGQGRLEACAALEIGDIPARILDLTTEEAMLFSLIENVARRTPRVKEEIDHILLLKKQGDSISAIAKKVGMSASQVARYCTLAKDGETRLLQAVLRKKISIEAAVIIASSESSEVRDLLHNAYDKKKLGKNELKIAKDIAEARLAHGKTQRRLGGKRKTNLTEDELVREVESNTAKKESIVKKARICEQKLLFIQISLKRLLNNKQFIGILKKEKLDQIPSSLVEYLS